MKHAGGSHLRHGDLDQSARGRRVERVRKEVVNDLFEHARNRKNPDFVACRRRKLQTVLDGERSPEGNTPHCDVTEIDLAKNRIA